MHLTSADKSNSYLRTLIILFTVILILPGCKKSGTEASWKDYGGGSDMSKYVAESQITKDNVDKLQIAWTYHTGDVASYQFNPIIVDTVMYVLAKNSSLVALNAITGKEIWIHANLRGITRRGINYWESEDRADRRLIFTMNNTLQEIDATTGQSILSFGKNGTIDLREGLGRDPKDITRITSSNPGNIFENLIILGSATGEGYFSSPGHLRAYNIKTGEMTWIFHTIPQPGEFGYETWPKDAYKYVGGTNTWGEISIDKERGIAYFPVGSPTYDYYGADRHGKNLFGSSLVALDARTGKLLWYFQTTHHDLWDYDPTAAPQLTTIERDGEKIDVVALATKQGFLFVFNRVTGDPIWPIEERSVPPSDMPGEEAWPTQPFPTVPPPFSRQKMTKEDLVPIFLTDDERKEWEVRLDSAKSGLYTPPSLKEVIAEPGANGGANWGNTAANPHTGMVYVLSMDLPSFYKLELVENNPTRSQQNRVAGDPAQIARGRMVYQTYCQACHGENREGSEAAPPLRGVVERMAYADLRRTVTSGKGRMPAVATITDEDVQRLVTFFSGGNIPVFPGIGQQAESQTPEGPVVASGGAPIENQNRGGFGPGVERNYPEGVDAPKQRYRTGYGLGYPYIMSPPWSWITAYDLNTGTIKWRKAHGQDKKASEAGIENAGVPKGSLRKGMIVTSTGIIFATGRDGKLYAYNDDNGEILWAGDMGCGSEGLPSAYTINGKQYIVVVATNPLTWGRDMSGGGATAARKEDEGGYVVFALPDK